MAARACADVEPAMGVRRPHATGPSALAGRRRVHRARTAPRLHAVCCHVRVAPGLGPDGPVGRARAVCALPARNPAAGLPPAGVARHTVPLGCTLPAGAIRVGELERRAGRRRHLPGPRWGHRMAGAGAARAGARCARRVRLGAGVLLPLPDRVHARRRRCVAGLRAEGSSGPVDDDWSGLPRGRRPEPAPRPLVLRRVGRDAMAVPGWRTSTTERLRPLARLRGGPRRCRSWSCSSRRSASSSSPCFSPGFGAVAAMCSCGPSCRLWSPTR